MPYVVVMHACSILTRTAFMHHGCPLGVYHPDSVIMMLGCNTYQLLTRAAFMYHDEKGANAVTRYVA